MKKIWITGAEGHIGTALLELLEGVEYQLLPRIFTRLILPKSMKSHSSFMSTVPTLSSTAPV